MSVVVMHIRWNGLSAAQRPLVEALVEQQRCDPACRSFTVRHDGAALLGTAVWDSEGSMLAFTLGPLARTTATALLDEPQVVLFAVPEPFARAYRRAEATAVPAPRAVVELVEQPAG